MKKSNGQFAIASNQIFGVLFLTVLIVASALAVGGIRDATALVNQGSAAQTYTVDNTTPEQLTTLPYILNSETIFNAPNGDPVYERDVNYTVDVDGLITWVGGAGNLTIDVYGVSTANGGSGF